MLKNLFENKTAPAVRELGPAEKVAAAEDELRKLEEQRGPLDSELATAEADGNTLRVEELNARVEKVESQIASARRVLATAQNALAIVRGRELAAARAEQERKVQAFGDRRAKNFARVERWYYEGRAALAEHYELCTEEKELAREDKRLGLSRPWPNPPGLAILARAEKELCVLEQKRAAAASPRKVPPTYMRPHLPHLAADMGAGAVRTWESPDDRRARAERR